MTAEQRRESVLTAATGVFAEYGYQRAKVSEIAARVGVSEPVVFQNFGTKAELFAAVLERASGTASVVLAAIGEQDLPVSDVLRSLLAPEHLDALHAPGSLGVLFADGTASVAEPVVQRAAHAAVRRVARDFAELLTRGQRAGDIRADLDAEAVSWWLISFISGRALRRAAVDDPGLEQRLIEMTIGTLTMQ